MVGCSYTTELDRARYVAFLNCVCKQLFVIFVRLQISQFASLGKCVNKLCFPFDLSEGRGSGRSDSGESLLSFPEDVDRGATIMSVSTSILQ